MSVYIVPSLVVFDDTIVTLEALVRPVYIDLALVLSDTSSALTPFISTASTATTS